MLPVAAACCRAPVGARPALAAAQPGAGQRRRRPAARLAIAQGLVKTGPVERAMRVVDRAHFVDHATIKSEVYQVGGRAAAAACFCAGEGCAGRCAARAGGPDDLGRGAAGQRRMGPVLVLALMLPPLRAQDSPLPIGHEQTISAPHMHAIALELLASRLVPGAQALDVGSGEQPSSALRPGRPLVGSCCAAAGVALAAAWPGCHAGVGARPAAANHTYHCSGKQQPLPQTRATSDSSLPPAAQARAT